MENPEKLLQGQIPENLTYDDVINLIMPFARKVMREPDVAMLMNATYPNSFKNYVFAHAAMEAIKEEIQLNNLCQNSFEMSLYLTR